MRSNWCRVADVCGTTSKRMFGIGFIIYLIGLIINLTIDLSDLSKAAKRK